MRADRLRLAGMAIALAALAVRAPGAAGLANQPPRVDAGLDLTVTLPAAARLEGSVRDDGLPDPPAHCTLEWSQVSGPAPAAFADSRSPETDAAFPEPGIYVLRLRADDSGAQASDEVLVSVRPNAPPIARSQEVATAEDTAVPVLLAGIDPEGDALTYAITEPPAHGELAGTPPALTYAPARDYHGVDGFRFAVSDGRHTSRSASVGLLVTAVNDPPTARPRVEPAAGPAPLTVRLDATASDDAEGPLLRYAWTFGDDTEEHEPRTTHVLREPGVHQVTLTVTDADGAARSETIQVRVFSATSMRLAFEAERVHLSAPATVAKDPEASGGAYVLWPRAGQGRVRCQFGLPAPATVTVWARVKSISETAASVSASVDGQPAAPIAAAGSAAGRWRWVQLVAGSPLEAGPHRLSVYPLEPGAAVDRLLVTDDPNLDPAWVPDGGGP